MKKINFLILSFLLVVFGTCKSQSKGDIQNKINYNSLIRPNISTWNLGDIYIDTLVYLFYDDNYDLPYAICKSLRGDTIAFYYDAYEKNDDITKLVSESVLEIKWKLDKFYEPGEGDDYYYSESLESYKIIKPLNFSLAQPNEDFIKTFMDLSELKTANNVAAFTTYDFSPLWGNTRNAIIFGVIGKNNLRIRVKLTSVNKHPTKDHTYNIKGKSLVKKNLLPFSGTITINEIREVRKQFYGLDETNNELVVFQGLVIATYKFNENKSQASTGIFEGKLYSKWYIAENGKVFYDEFYSYSDGYTNNAFIGTWKKYNSERSIVCNWGDYRIPLASYEFGDGEFLPAKKFDAYGWATYRKAYWDDDKEAMKFEKMEWWK